MRMGAVAYRVVCRCGARAASRTREFASWVLRVFLESDSYRKPGHRAVCSVLRCAFCFGVLSVILIVTHGT